MGVTARATGLDKLRSRVDAVVAGVAAEVDTALDAEGDAVVADQRAGINRVSGELQDAIAARRTDDHAVTVQPWNPDVWWAIFLEWGRQNAAAVPFATPSAELARQRWPKRARGAVVAGVRRR